MSFNGRQYVANYNQFPDSITGPRQYDIEVSDGKTPPGQFYPAHYLPLMVSENIIAGSYYVLLAGKTVALDSNNRIIPASLAKEFQEFAKVYEATAGTAAAKATAARAVVSTKYKAQDIALGILDAKGLPAREGDFIVEAMYNEGKGVSVTGPVGLIKYSALAAPGTDPSNPATFFKHNYDTGGVATITRWSYVQVPVVEINQRSEVIETGASQHRITVYNDGKLEILDASNATVALELKASPADFAHPAGATVPTEYAIYGRTVIFNFAVPANWKIKYMPKVDLPYTCLRIGNATTTKELKAGESAITKKDLHGKAVTFGMTSDFKLADSASDYLVGNILDVTAGSPQDLKLVLSHFRDLGLTSEAPGYATDGRNTQLTIANAPVYIARIAVNFNIPKYI
mgnify:CR=1 FL=1